MKKLSILFLVLAMSMAMLACSGNQRSANDAQTQTEAGKDNPGTSEGAATGATGSPQGAGMEQSREFMETAARDSQAEIMLGEMMSEKAQNPQVKQFANMMVKDHTAASQNLMQVAQQKNVQLPQEPSSEGQQLHQQLSDMKAGRDMDRMYMEKMVDAHQKDVSEFERVTQDNNADPQVKQFAEQTLPKLREHLQMAQQIQQKLGGTGTGGNR